MHVCGERVWHNNGLHMVFVVAITLHILQNKVTGVSAIV